MIEIKTINGTVLRRVEANTLDYADLRYADLRYADLYGANLRDANLRDANLRDADLRYADLYGADLAGADLAGADLAGADLAGADLSGALIADGVRLSGPRPIARIGPIGSRDGTLIGYRTDRGPCVRAGCWFGTIEDFRARVAEVHRDTRHRRDYDAACALLEVMLCE